MKKTTFFRLCIIFMLLFFTTGCAVPNWISANASLEKGNTFFDEENYEEAVACYDKAIKADRYNATAYGNRAAALNFLGRYQEALETVEKALEISPMDAMLFLNKGDILSSMGKNEEAIVEFDKALEKSPELLEAYRSKGAAYYDLGKYEEAIAEFDKALRIDSGYSTALLWMAQAYLSQGNDEMALDSCDRAIFKDKKNPEGYRKKADILMEMRDYEAAFDVIDKAIALNKESIDSYLDKLSMLFALKRYEECIAFGEESLKKFPEDEDINWYIGDSYSAEYLHNEAISYYDKILEKNPQNDQVAAYAGWESFLLQDYDKSQQYADRALEANDGNYDAQNLNEELKKTKLPDAERIVDFVKSNYLYLNDIESFSVKSEEFMKDTTVTAEDAEKYIQSIRPKKDMFTFVVSGKDYEELTQEEMQNQVAAYELDEDIFYVKIDTFTPTVGNDFIKALSQLKDTKDKALVIDLRGNTGGLIDAANDILDYMLPECSTSYVIDRNGYIQSYYSDESQREFKNILVLVDGYSASSAELLTLGLKKYLNNVTVIGQPTFGKGVGQYTYENKKDQYMIFLVSFYWNVKEQNIAGSRINPDVYLKQNTNEAFVEAIKNRLKP